MAATASETSKGPLCICHDHLLPIEQLTVPATDLGFIHGVAVSEQVRTIGRQPFLLDKHFDRWCRGLKAIALTPPCDWKTLRTSIGQLLDHNARLLPADAEQGICFFATPGNSNLGWDSVANEKLTNQTCATIGKEQEGCFSAYTYPLPVDRHRQQYRDGVRLLTTTIRDVPSACWPNSVKIRSRLHYYLAQQQAQSISPEAHPILLDQQSAVSDSAIASIVGWTPDEGLVVRPETQRYASITVEFLVKLAKQIGFAVTERTFSVAELQSFPEAFLASTPWCIYPVQQVDNIRLSGQSAGYPVFSSLAKAWESSVGCAIFSQSSY